jgi:hypothetical protein
MISTMINMKVKLVFKETFFFKRESYFVGVSKGMLVHSYVFSEIYGRTIKEDEKLGVN